MTEDFRLVLDGVIVEEDLVFTLDSLSRACDAGVTRVIEWVDEGVLVPVHPAGPDPHDWHFGGASLATARAAQRLNRDLDLGLAGTALVLDLLHQIATLQARLRRGGLI